MSNETGKVLNMCQWLEDQNDSKCIEAANLIMELFDQVRQQSDDAAMLTAQNDKLIREVEGLEAMINAERDFG